MEYLEMHGAVQLKPNVDRPLLDSVLEKLQAIEFIEDGYISIDRKETILCLDAEGVISDSISIKALLRELQDQLTSQSMILINGVRWETKILLKYSVPRQTPHFQSSPELELVQ